LVGIRHQGRGAAFMNTSIRAISVSELDTLLAMVSAYHDSAGIVVDDFRRRSSLLQILSDPSLGKIWFIASQDCVVGYVAVCLGFSLEFAGRDAFVDEIYVLPEYRNKGIAKETLRLIKEEAKKLNIRALHLEVDRNNKQAQNLYRKSQFKVAKSD